MDYRAKQLLEKVDQVLATEGNQAEKATAVSLTQLLRDLENLQSLQAALSAWEVPTRGGLIGGIKNIFLWPLNKILINMLSPVIAKQEKFNSAAVQTLKRIVAPND